MIALKLRSKGRIGASALLEEEEMDYVHVLNRALPPDIRVLGWTTAPPSFSARCPSARQPATFIFSVAFTAGNWMSRQIQRNSPATGHDDLNEILLPKPGSAL